MLTILFVIAGSRIHQVQEGYIAIPQLYTFPIENILFVGWRLLAFLTILAKLQKRSCTATIMRIDAF